MSYVKKLKRAKKISF